MVWTEFYHHHPAHTGCSFIKGIDLTPITALLSIHSFEKICMRLIFASELQVTKLTVWSEGFLYKVAPPELKISPIMYFVIHNSVVLSKILKIVVPFWPPVCLCRLLSNNQFYKVKISFSKICFYGTMIGNILDNTTELYMIKCTIGEIFSSGRAILCNNPSDQTVYWETIYVIKYNKNCWFIRRVYKSHLSKMGLKVILGIISLLIGNSLAFRDESSVISTHGVENGMY